MAELVDRQSKDYSAPVEREIPVALAGLRLDQALARLFPEHSRNRLQGWLREGRVTLDGRSAEIRRRVLGGERVVVAAPIVAADAPAAEPIPLAIVHEDEVLIVLDKPAGLVVHPGAGNRRGTLLNALLHHAPGLAGLPRAGIVHRLDKDTTGLLVVARTLPAQTDLVRQLAARTVRRHYVALAQGDLPGDGAIDAPIGRDPRVRTRMAVTGGGRPARTRYRVLERFGYATLLEVELETGRTHQIRVHLRSVGHPLVGDPTYGMRRSGEALLEPFPRQALHAARLGLVHPSTRLPCEWSSPLPRDFQRLLRELRERRR
jgi:23S rRNA pseudouridine1911/1915/1917 synthase